MGLAALDSNWREPEPDGQIHCIDITTVGSLANPGSAHFIELRARLRQSQRSLVIALSTGSVWLRFHLLQGSKRHGPR